MIQNWLAKYIPFIFSATFPPNGKNYDYGGKYLVFVSSRCEKAKFSLRDLPQLPQLSQFVYSLRKVCLFFNFWKIKCKIMSNKTQLCILLFKNWKINTPSSKSIQTEKAEEALFWQNKRRQKPDISHLDQSPQQQSQ